MSTNVENKVEQPVQVAQPEPTTPAIDLGEVTTRLAKHMERLPWATSRLSNNTSTAQLQQFIVDWIVPLLSDVHSVAMGSIGISLELQERLDEQAEDQEIFEDNVNTQIETAIAMSRNTMLGETLTLLHMHFKNLHASLLDKVQPTDPASFALTEMHDVFVRVGLEQPIDTPREEAAKVSDTPEIASV
jgi:hypothetical protein